MKHKCQFKKFILAKLSIFLLSFFYTNLVLSQQNTVELLSLMKIAKPGSTVDLAIQVKVKKGWHTYWQNSGDVGQPLEVTWNLDKKIQPSSLQWPIPSRINFGKWNNFGYKKDFLIMTRIKIPSVYSQDTLFIQANVKWLVCNNICVPMKKQIQISLPISSQEKMNSSVQALFAKTQNRLPQKSFITGLLHKNQIHLTSKKPFQLIDFFPIHSFSNKLPKVKKNSPHSYTLTFPEEIKKSASFSSLVVFRKDQKIQSSKAIISIKNQTLSLLLFAVMAFVGGLILNVMPCVLPVVFLKFYHVTKSKKLIASSLMYSTGVITSFVGLGLLIGFLKLGSQNLGWGFQMQSPIFISFLIFLFSFIGFSFLDLFSVPKYLNPFQSHSKNLMGDLFSGLIAVLAATPCTAPFMGVAIGFAFSQSITSIVFIFSALGLGMAFPYLILCFVPKWIKKIPYSGRWNHHLKHLLALPMFITVIWLINILFSLNSYWVFPILIAVLGYGFLFWMARLPKKTYPKWVSRGILIVSLFCTAYPVLWDPLQKNSVVTSQSTQWRKFSPFLLTQLRSKNKAVLLNITAKWCITCHYNERFTFRNKKVIHFLKNREVIQLQGDWTSKDPSISKTLKQYDRAGIPFTIFFPPHNQPPVILPEILTPNLLMKKIANAL